MWLQNTNKRTPEVVAFKNLLKYCRTPMSYDTVTDTASSQGATPNIFGMCRAGYEDIAFWHENPVHRVPIPPNGRDFTP